MEKILKELKQILDHHLTKNPLGVRLTQEDRIIHAMQDFASLQTQEKDKEIERLKKYCASEGALNSVQRMKLDKVERDKIKFSEEQNIKLHEENEELIVLIESQQKELESFGIILRSKNDQLDSQQKEIEVLIEKLDKKQLKITSLESEVVELEIKKNSYITSYESQLSEVTKERDELRGGVKGIDASLLGLCDGLIFEKYDNKVIVAIQQVILNNKSLLTPTKE